MSKIIEASGIPEDTKVYLKKDWTGWRVVEPIMDENKKILWKRLIFGTRKERVFLAFIILIIISGYLAYREQLNNYYSVLNDPCSYCKDCQLHTNQIVKNLSSIRIRPMINISSLLPDS